MVRKKTLKGCFENKKNDDQILKDDEIKKF
jgi:hypothetical protein